MANKPPPRDAMSMWEWVRLVGGREASATAVAIPLLSYHLEMYGSVLGPYVSQSGSLALRSLAGWLDTMFWLMASPSRGVTGMSQ